MRERRKVLKGRVVGNSMDKTVVVLVERLFRHRIYKKVIKATKKYKAHDEQNACHVGDLVQIVESRPLSRTKRWVVTEITQRAD